MFYLILLHIQRNNLNSYGFTSTGYSQDTLWNNANKRPQKMIFSPRPIFSCFWITAWKERSSDSLSWDRRMKLSRNLARGFWRGETGWEIALPPVKKEGAIFGRDCPEFLSLPQCSRIKVNWESTSTPTYVNSVRVCWQVHGDARRQVAQACCHWCWEPHGDHYSSC